NYFKTALRSIRRNKMYSTLNILGLALGIASCVIIFLVVKYELGYDGFNKKADRIYRVTLNAIDFNPSVSMAIAPAMRTSFPELEQVSQVWHQGDGLVTIGQTRFSENNFAYADEHFAKIFDYEWLSGDANTALSEPNAIVLTTTVAKKYFGNTNAMGQIINLDNQHNLKVTGIIKDLPGNTSFPFTFLVSFETIKEDVKGMMNQFYAIAGGNTYILLPEHYDVENIHKRIPAFIEKHWGKELAKEARLPLQPLKDIHFDQRYLNSDVAPTTSRETYWALTAIAVFIIIIACINFVNLATAQAIRRAREIGVRKVLGSSRFQLMGQFLGETTCMVFIALVFALLAVILFLPQLAQWLDIKITVRQLMEPATLSVIVAIAVSMILLAGLYPAFIQSAFNPVQSLKSQPAVSFRGLTLRKSLVVVQFAISQAMIVGTLVVAYQMDFFKNRDLGFDKDAVISIGMPDKAKREVLRQQLISNPGVKEVSFASGAPAYSYSYSDFSAPELGVTKGDVTELKSIDENYTSMFKLTMLAGKPVEKKNDTDTTQEAVINETLMQKLNIFDPQQAVGKHIMINGWYTAVTGVVKDFQSESKHKKRRPCAFFYRAKNFYTACIKLHPAAMQKTIAGIDKSWSAIFPNELFKYEFLDEHIAHWYRQEEKQYTAFKLFAGIAILIGCLGLYGLVAFAAAQRTKEVGIRKVLGASLSSIVLLFSREFVILIAVAFLIAAPLAYYVMHNWLQNFAYQVNIGAGIFIIAILASVLIAGATIAYQAIKAAVANPVKSLRSE
ncbi:MAG TPA: ABC transporter permease, partial [Chitinophagaceae bacterium]|nr:ABC transporter permease [Chitinophagaceae bacterium]